MCHDYGSMSTHLNRHGRPIVVGDTVAIQFSVVQLLPEARTQRPVLVQAVHTPAGELPLKIQTAPGFFEDVDAVVSKAIEAEILALPEKFAGYGLINFGIHDFGGQIPFFGVVFEFAKPDENPVFEDSIARQAIILAKGADMATVGAAFVKLGEALLKPSEDVLVMDEDILTGRELVKPADFDEAFQGLTMKERKEGERIQFADPGLQGSNGPDDSAFGQGQPDPRETSGLDPHGGGVPSGLPPADWPVNADVHGNLSTTASTPAVSSSPITDAEVAANAPRVAAENAELGRTLDEKPNGAAAESEATKADRNAEKSEPKPNLASNGPSHQIRENKAQAAEDNAKPGVSDK